MLGKREDLTVQICISVHEFSHSDVSNSLWLHGLLHIRLPSPTPPPRAYSNSCSSSRWCHPPSHSLSSPSPPTFSLSQHQDLFQWISSSHQVAKVLELHLEQKSFQWILNTVKFMIQHVSCCFTLIHLFLLNSYAFAEGQVTENCRQCLTKSPW